ncbi:TrpR family transcriptional regulator, trp operon repressor [Alphaproteobacteria bacterium]
MQLKKEEKSLYDAILSLENREECTALFNDLATPAEIKSIHERWVVACLLFSTHLSYRQIHEQTGVSIATITRVARFLQHEKYNGYKFALERFKDTIDKGEKVDAYEAILALQSIEECYYLFSDLCTPSEMRSMQERWLVADLLYSTTLSYRQIHEQTGVSIATITRVARFLQHEKYNGYKLLLERTQNKAGVANVQLRKAVFGG